MKIEFPSDVMIHELSAEERVLLDPQRGFLYGTFGLATRILDHLRRHRDLSEARSRFDTEAPGEVESLTSTLLAAGLLEGDPEARAEADFTAPGLRSGDEVPAFLASGDAERHACLLRHGSVRSLTLGPSAGVGESGNPLIFRSPE